MDILYSTHTKLTYEEYLRMYKFSRRKMKIIGIALTVFEALSAILLSVICFFHGFDARVILSWVLFAVFVGVELYQERVIPKKYFESFKSGSNGELTINFYSDRLEQVAEKGNVILRYDEIYKIYETKMNFYILISAREVIIIAKENCRDELCEFIRGKMRRK